MTLDSLGVTWLIIELTTGFFCIVMAVTSIVLLYSSSAISRGIHQGPLPVPDTRDRYTFDHDLGLRRHIEVYGFAFTVLINPPASPPATVNSSTPNLTFCGPRIPPPAGNQG